MYKVQIFQDSLAAVSEETGLEENQILSNAKSEEIVDARSILIKVMEEQGLSREEVGRLFGEILECAGVFKWDEEGRAALQRFLAKL
jgi:UDPglucose--hexose-1-phosphate uridylyltransferase